MSKTIYVNAITGDDTNPGTEEAPVASLCRVAELAEEGDTVKIGNDFYQYVRSCVLCQSGGGDK